MSMNTPDERLYHYEYRRPRVNNPTYNSINVFDSMNMFIMNGYPTPLMRSYGRFSLQKDSSNLGNKSEVVNSRYYKPSDNYSTIQPPTQSPRQNMLLNDKDYLYLQMLDQKNKKSRITKNYDYGLSACRVSENAENRSQFNMKSGDSLTKEVKEFDTHKK